MELEFDDELFRCECDSLAELFEHEPESLFGFIKKWFNKEKAGVLGSFFLSSLSKEKTNLVKVLGTEGYNLGQYVNIN